MRARRALALGLAVAALLASVALLVQGARCGMSSTSAECSVGKECARPVTECESYIHPVAWPLLISSLVAIGAAWIEAPMLALAVGVGLGAIGAVFGSSLGPWGVGIALFIAASGAAATRAKRIVAATGLLATVLPIFLLVALTLLYAAKWSGFGKMSAPHPSLVFALAAGPGILWVVLLMISRRGAPQG